MPGIQWRHPTASFHGEEDNGRGLHGEGIRASRWRPHLSRARVGGELARSRHEQEKRVGLGWHGMHVQDTVQNAGGMAMPRVLQGKLAKTVPPTGYSHHHLNNQTKNKQKQQSW